MSHFQVIGIWWPKNEKCKEMDKNTIIWRESGQLSENCKQTLNLTSYCVPILTQLEQGDKCTHSFNSHHSVIELYPISFKYSKLFQQCACSQRCCEVFYHRLTVFHGHEAVWSMTRKCWIINLEPSKTSVFSLNVPPSAGIQKQTSSSPFLLKAPKNMSKAQIA